MSGNSSSDNERMGLQIKPPPLVHSGSSRSTSKSQSHERRRDLASRLGPRDSAYSSGNQERSAKSSSKSYRRIDSSGDRRDRTRHPRDGGSYMQQQPYDEQRERAHQMLQGGSNWERSRDPRIYNREYQHVQERPRKRSVRDRLGPADPNSRSRRYWEEKSAGGNTSTSHMSSIQGLELDRTDSTSNPHRENRSNELIKHKQRRKHLEQEEVRAFREIEKRRQKERQEEERRAPTSRDKHGRTGSRQAQEDEEDMHEGKGHHSSEEMEAIDPDGVNQEEEEEEVGLIEVEDVEPSSSSEEGEEEVEVEEGVLPSNSDLSGNSESEGESEARHRANKHEKVGRGRVSANPSAQNSDISSEEEQEAEDGSQRESSSSKSSTGTNSESSEEESKSSADDQRDEHNSSPKSKRSRRRKNKVKSRNSSSSSKKKGQENGTKSLEKSDSENSGKDKEGNMSDIEMIEVVGNDAAAPKLPEIKVPEVELTDVEKKKLELDLLPNYFPAMQGCRRVEEFSLLNRIEEGTYGVVYRAKDKRTNEIVALKRLKMEKEKDGFPITSLREINTLLKAQHENIVTVREIVVGSNTDKIFLVMDYVEHDLKALMETLKQKEQAFILVEIKCLMIQLLKAVAHLHDNWILHRDLKASNILLSHKGILKVGDFGLAREYGSPLKAYTPIVVTLWYRSPELLLQTKEYSTPIDMWSVGCIFGELLKMEPMFPGKSEANQLNLIFSTLGTPNDKIWPGYSKLPLLQKLTFTENPVNKLKTKFGMLSELGIDLLNKLLTYNPAKRITAEDALKHGFFTERPLPIDPSVFSTWPAKSEMGHRKAVASPKPPSGGRQFKDLREEDEGAGFFLGLGDRRPPIGAGFNLKF